MRSIIIFTMVLATVTAQPFAQAGKIPVGGKDRDYIVYAPSGLPEHPPLVLALHALAQTNTQFRSSSKWDAIADKDKIVVVYPVGITPVSMGGSSMIGWDITGDSDVKFMTALIDTMAARYQIDRSRVYSTGFSMGGMLSYVLACRVSDRIAAIGPDAGYPVGQNASSCKASAPVSVCHVHGADDDFVTYSGVADWIKKFAGLATCQQSPTTTKPSSKATKEAWGPCENGYDVVFYTVAGMAHAYATSSANSFSATDTFWNFFKLHSRGTIVATEKPMPGAQTVSSFSAASSGGTIRLVVNQEINSVRVFDVHGRSIYSWKGNAPTGAMTVPVGRATGEICIIKVAGPAGSSVGRVLIH